MPSLIFFVCLLLAVLFCGCSDREASENVKLIYSGKKAIAVSISSDALTTAGADAKLLLDSSYISTRLSVRAESSSTNIIGTFAQTDQQVIFEPAIPFRPGKNFEWYFQDRLAGSFAIPSPDSSAAAIVKKMYPSTDTVPENLLKIYFEFSAPMREGEALQHIHLLNASGDTIKDVFLDLQPELWNSDRTGLTVWLDPGRIKRDLIPNLEKGKPLVEGQQYQVKVSGKWLDAAGLQLKSDFTRQLFVSSRDSLTPALSRWRLKTPPAGSKTALMITFDEPLDFYLLGETIAVAMIKPNTSKSDQGDEETDVPSTIPGQIIIAADEKGISFIPDQPWKPGRHIIRVDSKLEDLAGNNFNRPFDNDALANKARNKPFYQLQFEIAPYSEGLR